MSEGSLLDLGPVNDRDRIRAAVSDVFTPHALDVMKGAVLDASLRVREAGRIKLVWVAYGAPVKIDVTPPPQRFHLIQIPLSGRVSIVSGSEEVVSNSSTASIPDARVPCTMRWEANSSEVILRIEEDALHRHLESLLGYPVKTPIRFALGMSLNSGPGTGWRTAVDMMITELHRDGGLLDSPLASAQLESFVLTGLLVAQPHNYSSALHTNSPPARPRGVRKALEYIEAECDRAITTERLAAHVGTSARALQRGFQEHVGCSPMEYLRDVRLKRARDALLAADPSSNLSVTEIALDSGFMHLGRFSVEYRQRFGELPSQTLRR
ncbi:AraC family transcriptional regulator [Mycobacterium novum]